MKKIIYSLATALTLLAGCTQSEPYNAYVNTNRRTDTGKSSIILFADTSPSMNDSANGVPKIESAKAALYSALNVFKEHNNFNHNLEVGLLSIGDSQRIRVDVPLTNFNYSLLSNAVYKMPTGDGTPLGPGLEEARRQLEDSGNGLEGIIMFTDGEANSGRDPTKVYSSIIAADMKAGRPRTKLHFVAFDTDPEILDYYKHLGAQTYSAEDGQRLKEALVSASEKILLEEEEVSTNNVRK